jgi:ABC-type polysaccharide/polyol phosphate transport system ATPase subunit
MGATDPVIELDHVSKWYRDRAYRAWLVHEVYRWALRRGGAPSAPRWALRDVTLSVARGEALGVVGPNGAGKSTLLKVMAGISTPSAGVVRRQGRISTQLGVGLGFDPLLTGRDNIYLEGTILGLTNRDISTRLGRIVEFSGLASDIDQPVWTYSSGMVARLGFSIAAHVDFETLLMDEALSAGDAAFRERCDATLERFRADGRTLVIVSHELESVSRLCDRVVWLENAQIREDGPAGPVVEHYEGISDVGEPSDEGPATESAAEL